MSNNLRLEMLDTSVEQPDPFQQANSRERQRYIGMIAGSIITLLLCGGLGYAFFALGNLPK